jgi:hypothetical protein
MALTLEFCEMRADEAALAADKAKLDNVRERELRAEATWRALAAREREIREGRRDRT